VKTSVSANGSYSYEEFADHIRAMKTVRQWEYTSRFGYIGGSQTSQANIARALEYFIDTYDDQTEAVRKAERFLSVCDYIAKHTDFFSRRRMIDVENDGTLAVEAALLRAVHHVFTALETPETTDPKKVLGLAEAYQAFN
jgi:hypothetical protein